MAAVAKSQNLTIRWLGTLASQPHSLVVPSPHAPVANPDAGALFEQHYAFVFRSVRRLGVPPSLVDDAVQDVFLVVHRRLEDFAGRSTIQTWLYGIILRVVADYRRANRRRANVLIQFEGEGNSALSNEAGPADLLARREAARVLNRVLDALDDDKRAVFVSVELEQMTMPQIAEALGINVNTAYARLRAARQQFSEAVTKLRGQDGGNST